MVALAVSPSTVTLTCKSYQDYVDAITEAALNSEDETRCV